MPLMADRRNTRQHDAIRTAIQQAGRPLSIDEIHDAARTAVPSLGVRTVYRAVRRMEEASEIVRVGVPGQTDRYESAKAAANHHHHFHCLVCDRVFDVDGCPGRLAAMVPTGFVLEHHEITLSGRCDACA